MPKLNHADNPIQFYTATILEWKNLVSLLVITPTRANVLSD
jgi:hypothetical protein